jgi:molybdopterin/thiamine biosynthesis adenylyltransferase
MSVLSPTPALIAAFQVQEVIKVLLERGTTLRKKLLFINSEDLDINILELE